MKRAALIARLRDLQGKAYGAYASATHYADRDEDNDRRRTSRYPIMVSSLHHQTEHIAREIDELIAEIEQVRTRGPRK